VAVCTAVQALRALERAVERRCEDWGPETARPVIRTDNGPQFTAHVWAEGCQRLGIHHERIPNATPNKNAHIESWHSILEAECLRDRVFNTLTEGYDELHRWIDFYNERRMHGSLHDWAPNQFYHWWQQGLATPIKDIHC